MDFLYEGLNAGASIKAVADLIGICSRTLRRWGLDISGQGSVWIAARVPRVKWLTDSLQKSGNG